MILLRHTRPDVAPGVCYGQSDLPLADSFEEEFAALLDTLPEFDAILTSPLRRCRLLADRIGAARDIRPVGDPRIAEIDFGRWEMTAWTHIPGDELNAWARDFMHARPHGGESVSDLFARVADFLDETDDGTGRRLVVTHSGVIRAALAARGIPGAWEEDTGYGAFRPLPARSAPNRREG